MQNNPYASSPGTVAAAALKDPIKNVYLCISMIRLPFAASSRVTRTFAIHPCSSADRA